MNCRTIVIITFYILFFNMPARAAEVGKQDTIEIGFIQDNKGRKWSVFRGAENNFFALFNNEQVKVAQCRTRKLSNNLYVLYFVDGHTTTKNELVSSEKSLEEAPTIYK